ncbi:putative patatin/cPLA2 family phospholipase [Peptoniphilus olsenii]|uniref:Patatin/cPLA2 family phospholipase n=1 Tax=Peptoniphilus olsenii TaxID=411570 RepID=A0ABV2JB08_9FIRM
MKTGLVLEGGAMRGMYTAGVLDVFMDNNIAFDGIIGVSAGALFGVNFLSNQKGRVIRYNKKYNKDKHYMGILPLLKTGNIIDTDYAYYKVPFELDVFDDATFKKSNVPFYAVMTNAETGEPEYFIVKSVLEQMDWLRASGSMPFLSKPVKIGNKLYMDGAITDSIPFKFMLEHGYDRLVVILTKPKNYIKKPLPPHITNLIYKKEFPKLADKIRNRHKMYNKQMSDLQKLERKKIIKIIRPSSKPKVGRIEKDSNKLEELYQLGRRDCHEFLKRERVRNL